MAVVKWRPQALRDLEAFESYYEELAPEYARFFVDAVFEKTKQLEQFPRMGRMVPEIGNESIREIIYRTYRLIYIVNEGDKIEV